MKSRMLAAMLAMSLGLGACAALTEMGAKRVKEARLAENKGVTLKFGTMEAGNAAVAALKAMGMEVNEKSTGKGPDSLSKKVVGFRPAKSERAGKLETLTKFMGGKPQDMLVLDLNGKWNETLDAALPGQAVCRFETYNADQDLTGAYHPGAKVENPELVKEAKAALVKAARVEREGFNKGVDVRGNLDQVEQAIRAVLADYDPDLPSTKKTIKSTLGPGGDGRFLNGVDKRAVKSGSDMASNLAKSLFKLKGSIASHVEHVIRVRFHKKWDASLVKEEPGTVVLQIYGESKHLDTDGKVTGTRQMDEATVQSIAADIRSKLR